VVQSEVIMLGDRLFQSKKRKRMREKAGKMEGNTRENTYRWELGGTGIARRKLNRVSRRKRIREMLGEKGSQPEGGKEIFLTTLTSCFLEIEKLNWSMPGIKQQGEGRRECKKIGGRLGSHTSRPRRKKKSGKTWGIYPKETAQKGHKRGGGGQPESLPWG